MTNVPIISIFISLLALLYIFSLKSIVVGGVMNDQEWQDYRSKCLPKDFVNTPIATILQYRYIKKLLKIRGRSVLLLHLVVAHYILLLGSITFLFSMGWVIFIGS